VIRNVLCWLALADAVAAVLLAAIIHAIGRRTPGSVTVGRAIGLAVLLGSPAAALFAAAWLIAKLF
jgi:hypothetical protein